MKRLRWLSFLMVLTILGVAGFLSYWLYQNYRREEKSLAIRSEVTFRESIQNLQVAELKLGNMPSDSGDKTDVKILTEDLNENVTFTPRRELISTINVIGEKLNDSLKNLKKKGKTIVITSDQMKFSPAGDTSLHFKRIPDSRRDHFIQILYRVDSLQDSLKIKDIRAAYSRSLHEQKLDVPFAIQRLDSVEDNGNSFNEMTIGLAHPVTYRMKLGNTFPFLFKKISLPLLFAVLLLGITILSFVLLYKTLLKQQRLAEIKNEFISNITHELKTPIATVGVAIEALKSFNAIQDPQRTMEYLDISSNELQRLGMLVDKVLKLSVFETQEIELRYEPLNMKSLVEEVTNSMRLQLEKNHAVVTITEQGNLDLEGDILHLQSVIFNLLDNAIKYSKENPVIHINLQEKGDKILLEVTDNGIGIPAEYKEKIFEKFFRIPHGDTHNAKGYGLGLSYAAHVVRKHQGTISLESQPGIGAKFIIQLPKHPLVSEHNKLK